MIKAQDIIAQLQVLLPAQTDLFTDNDIAITSLSQSGTTVTAKTSSVHNLTTGSYVSITGATTPIAISSISCVKNSGNSNNTSLVTVTLASDHDFTERFDFKTTVSGVTQLAYNGTFDVLNVPNRRQFTYELPSVPITPGTGNNKRILDDLGFGYNGLQQVTVVDQFTFTYQVTSVLGTPAEGSPVMRGNIRVGGAMTLERAQQVYTKQAINKLWAFVVLGGNVISKDRNVSTDANSTLAPGDEYRMRIISNFSVMVFAPTAANDLSGRIARDQIEDVRVALYKSLLRAKFKPVLSSEALYLVTTPGDRLAAYNTAYYVHEFVFEIVADIVLEDAISGDIGRAFRNFTMQQIDPSKDDGTNVIMEIDNANLDDVPFTG